MQPRINEGRPGFDMKMEDWLLQYGNADSPQDELEGIHKFRALMEGKKVYLWGAGSVVRLYVDLFKKTGIPVAGLIDKQSHGGTVEGCEVLPPSALLSLGDPRNTVIVTSAGSTMVAAYIAADFEALGADLPPIVLGYRLFYALQNLICRRKVRDGESPELFLCPMCRTFGSTCPVLLDQAGEKHGGNLVLSLAAYGLGTVCTLKCEYCVEGIPYVPHGKRAFVPMETVIKDIEKFTEACDYIVRLDFCGGEPFLHPQLEEILNYAVAVRNIGYFYVITNGTVVPGDSLGAVLCNPRMKVVISDYSGQLSLKLVSNIEKTARKLKESGVSTERRRHLAWSDINSFAPRGLSSAQMEKAYKSCPFVNSRRLHEGVLYPCLHYFAGVQTGDLAAEPDECLHIHDIPGKQLAEAIQRYLNQPYVSACDRCLAPFDAPEVPAARQAEKIKE